MYELSVAHWRSCSIYVAAKLGIADILDKHGPLSAAAIADITHCHADALHRLMRALASIEVFRENEDQLFELTALGNTLTSNAPNSMLWWVLTMLGERLLPWNQLIYSIQTGKTSFEHVYQMPVWQYYATHAEQRRNYIRAMENNTRLFIPHIHAAYDFSQFKLLADIGGGNGSLLLSILDNNPHCNGILFDLLAVITAARNSLVPNTRCSLAAGDFFQSVPADADGYILKNIIHDWHDDASVLILKTCMQAMHHNSRLLLIEAVLPPGNEKHPGKFMDINMLAMQGGRERTAVEYKELLAKAGLQIIQIISTNKPDCSIIECIKQA